MVYNVYIYTYYTYIIYIYINMIICICIYIYVHYIILRSFSRYLEGLGTWTAASRPRPWTTARSRTPGDDRPRISKMFGCSNFLDGQVHISVKNQCWLVVSTYPSEKWWSESQLGWWNSQYMEKTLTSINIHETTIIHYSQLNGKS